MHRYCVFAVVVALTLMSASAAQASPITVYGSRAAFLAATTGVTTMDFEAQNPNGDSGYGYYGATMVVGDVTFTQPDERMFVFGKSFYATSGVTSSYLSAPNCCGPEGLTLTFASPVYAVGMDLGIQNNWSSYGAGFNAVNFTLSTGETFSVLAPMLYETGSPFMFYGFSSPVPFSSVLILSPSEGPAFDNISYTSNPVGQSTVPDPGSSLLLLGMGLVGLKAWRKLFR